MDFYVGQEVVAIKDHSQGRFKKGQEFVILGIKKGCKHYPLLIDIGVKESVMYESHCNECSHKIFDNILWFCASCFTPKQQLSQTTYNEVMMWIEQGNEKAILN